jgi:two-component system CheB/CheR fusion protein
MAANAVRENQFHLTGPSVRLSIRGAETMALTLHELTTNALKFGALTTDDGHIAVTWYVDESTEPGWLRWHWVETGVSMAATTPPRRGFGQELIERVLPYELDARTRFAFAPGGLLCDIALPINERTVSLGDAP